MSLARNGLLAQMPFIDPYEVDPRLSLPPDPRSHPHYEPRSSGLDFTKNALLAAALTPTAAGDAADIAYFGTRAATEPEYRGGLLDAIRPKGALLRNLPLMWVADAMLSDQPMGPALTTIDALGLNEPQMDAVSAALPLVGAPVAAMRRADDVGGLLHDVPVGARRADDVPQMNWRDEAPRPPELTRKSVGRGGRIPGAPADVMTRADEVAKIDNYLAEAEVGVPGRDWYSDVAARMARDTGNISGARPGSQDRAAAVFGAYSPRMQIKGNRLAQIRANNQFAVGDEIAAGMGARNRSAQSILETGHFPDEDALKVGLFALQSRGFDVPRGVHDIRDFSQWGFGNQFSPGLANHRWVDKVMDEAVELANQRRLGGFDDWTHDRLQAATWVAHKARETNRSVDDIIREMSQADEWLRANLYVEAIPSRELSGLLDADMGARQAYTAAHAGAFSNPEGQNALMQRLGLYSPEMRYGVGEWEGNFNPNVRTVIGADPGKGLLGNQISSSSREAVEFGGAIEGLLGGQTNVAYDYLRPDAMVRANSVVIDFDRPVTEADLNAHLTPLRQQFGKVEAGSSDERIIANIRGENQLVIQDLGPSYSPTADTNTAFNKAVREMAEGRVTPAHNSGQLILDPEKVDQYLPSAWMEKLQNPVLRERVSGMLPEIAADIRSQLADIPLTDRGRDVYLKTVDLIEKGGLEAVEEAVKAGILPAAVLGLILGSEFLPEQPSGQQGLDQATTAGL